MGLRIRTNIAAINAQRRRHSTSESDMTHILNKQDIVEPSEPEEELKVTVGTHHIIEINAPDDEYHIKVTKLDYSGKEFYGDVLIPEEINVQEENPILHLEEALQKINDFRSYLGAMQNQLSSSLGTLPIEKDTFGESRNHLMMNKDYSYESAQHIRDRILLHHRSSELDSAPFIPKMALSLLR